MTSFNWNLLWAPLVIHRRSWQGLSMCPMGDRAFMPLRDTQRLLRAPGTATGVLLNFDGQPSAKLLKRLYDIPQIAKDRVRWRDQALS